MIFVNSRFCKLFCSAFTSVTATNAIILSQNDGICTVLWSVKKGIERCFSNG
jgi:hypothetical protein